MGYFYEKSCQSVRPLSVVAQRFIAWLVVVVTALVECKNIARQIVKQYLCIGI